MKLSKMSSILSMVTMLFVHSMPVMAQETMNIIDNRIEVDNSSSEGERVLTPIESEKLGSITIRLENTEKQLPKDEVQFGIVKVADVFHGEFVLEEAYEDSQVNLNEIKNANELEFAAKKLEKVMKTPAAYVVTNDAGIANISDLSVGVYLIYAEDIADYENITPFLISVPTLYESEGVMEYDVEVCPKHTTQEEKERPEVPQTGIDNYVEEFAVISIISFTLAILLLGIYFFKRNQV